MVCTTIRPTTLPYSQLSTWQECASFIADHVIYEPLPEPVLIVSTLFNNIKDAGVYKTELNNRHNTVTICPDNLRITSSII